MQLKDLIKDLNVIDAIGSLDVDITDVAYHTKNVTKGSAFIAISGNAADGHDFVDMAIERGAKAIISSKMAQVPPDITNIIVANPRRALALMSSHLFDEPSKLFTLIGITGTNGKTTITYLLESICKVAGYNVGVVGTINYRYGDIKTNPEHTTPESYELQKLFRNMADADVNCVAMEVSSHSLDQDRVYGCHFDGAIFTNLTQDHLDYHLDMERYKVAKSQLFNRHLPESIKKNIWAAVNVDDPFGGKIAADLAYKVYTFSIGKDADVSVIEAKYSLSGTDLQIKVGKDKIKIGSHLVGMHNASNVLGAITAAHAMGISSDKIKKGVENVGSVPGRLQPVLNSKKLNVLIDYAHTPDALRNVTTALKALKPKRLITVFGCGGNRDKTKRPLMGFETALKSDVLVITSDNPRDENPKKIIDEIISGVKKVGIEEGAGEEGGYLVEVDRKEAIRRAVEIATPEDVILIAGKGHEDYQIVGAEKRPFDDLAVASEIIEAL